MSMTTRVEFDRVERLALNRTGLFLVLFSLTALALAPSVLLAQGIPAEKDPEAHRAGILQAFRVCLRQQKDKGNITPDEYRRCDSSAERLYFDKYNADYKEHYRGPNDPASRRFVEEAQRVVTAVSAHPELCESEAGQFQAARELVVTEIKNFYPGHPNLRCGQCVSPKKAWQQSELNIPAGLHGPYGSVDEALNMDAAGCVAMQETRRTTAAGDSMTEYGFVILRRKTGSQYYTTPPVRGRSNDLKIRPEDYASSIEAAFTASCEKKEDFSYAADVHTHPTAVTSNYFSGLDFNHGIEIRNKAGTVPPNIGVQLAIEKIFLINVPKRVAYYFVPQTTDALIPNVDQSTGTEARFSELWWLDYMGCLLCVPRSIWWDYTKPDRLKWAREYPDYPNTDPVTCLRQGQ
ncbi:MAG TPA: hypothetical protein VNZ53_15490 [Steroidobacteraceae bacterium]|nr:hypothetical protein [Steroidobacteraceae bacterium]